jgi:hypothetical protein
MHRYVPILAISRLMSVIESSTGHVMFLSAEVKVASQRVTNQDTGQKNKDFIIRGMYYDIKREANWTRKRFLFG